MRGDEKIPFIHIKKKVLKILFLMNKKKEFGNVVSLARNNKSRNNVERSLNGTTTTK
jgi:hypothetical protein